MAKRETKAEKKQRKTEKKCLGRWKPQEKITDAGNKWGHAPRNSLEGTGMLRRQKQRTFINCKHDEEDKLL